MNNLLRIRTLTDRFFDGNTTPEEEQELYDFFAEEQIPEDLRPVQELFRDLAALTTLAPARDEGETLAPVRDEDENLVPARDEEETLAQHRSLSPRRRDWWLSAAAAVALLIVGGAALFHYQHEDECVAYIYGERVTDHDVVLAEMQKTMTAMAADGSDVVEEQLKAMFAN